MTWYLVFTVVAFVIVVYSWKEFGEGDFGVEASAIIIFLSVLWPVTLMMVIAGLIREKDEP